MPICYNTEKPLLKRGFSALTLIIMELSKYFSKKPNLQVGVDIGQGVLKIALLEFLAGQTRLLSYKCVDISRFKPDEDDEKNGFILQQTEDFIKTHGLLKKSIHLNLPITNAVFAKAVRLPNMPVGEISNAAKWQIKDEVQVDIKETEFAWQFASPQTKPTKPHTDIICVAAKRDFLDKYIQLFKSANISLSEITFSPFSINAILSADEGTIAVLDIGYRQSIFSFHSGNRVLFLRTIHVGADNITKPQQENSKVDIEHMCDELVRSIKYCELEFTKQAINTIYLTGGGAKMESLYTQLKEISGLDMKILRFPRDIYVDENIRKDFQTNRDSFQIMPAVGAAVSFDLKINVLPAEARTEKILLAQRISFRLLGLTVMLILILSSFAIRLQVNILKKNLSNAEAELAFLKQAEVLKSDINEYKNMIDYIKKGYIPPEFGLKFISKTMPENMALNTFVFNNENKTVNLIGIIYIRSGAAEEAITEFIRNLKQIKLFEDAKIISIEKASGDNSTFNIVCNIAK